MTRRCALLDMGTVDYQEAWDLQRACVARRLEDAIPDLLLLGQHPPVYTVGRRGSAAGLDARGIPVYEVERGGDVTYHGPGQLVGYPILSLPKGKLDVRAYVSRVEEVLRRAVAPYGLQGGEGAHAGLWVAGRKLGSIGIAIKRHVTYHGFALNVDMDLAPFRRIRPCGLEGRLLTSMAEVLGRPVDVGEVKDHVISAFAAVFHAVLQPEEGLWETLLPPSAVPGEG